MIDQTRIPPDLFAFIQRRYISSWSDVLRQDPCAYCGDYGGTVDHIVPRCGGGEVSAMTNGTGACERCNLIKSDASLLHFLLNQRKRDRHRRTYHAQIGRGSLTGRFFSEEQISKMYEVLNG